MPQKEKIHFDIKLLSTYNQWQLFESITRI